MCINEVPILILNLARISMAAAAPPVATSKTPCVPHPFVAFEL